MAGRRCRRLPAAPRAPAPAAPRSARPLAAPAPAAAAPPPVGARSAGGSGTQSTELTITSSGLPSATERCTQRRVGGWRRALPPVPSHLLRRLLAAALALGASQVPWQLSLGALCGQGAAAGGAGRPLLAGRARHCCRGCTTAGHNAADCGNKQMGANGAPCTVGLLCWLSRSGGCWGAHSCETHWRIALAAPSQSRQARRSASQRCSTMATALPQRPCAAGPCCVIAARPALAAAALSRRRVAPQCSSSAAGTPAAWQQQPAPQRHPLVQRLAAATQRAAAAVEAQRAAAGAALAR